MKDTDTYTAFEGTSLIHRGVLTDVVQKVKKRMTKSGAGSFLIFSDSTGKTMEFNFQGTESEVLRRLDVFTSREESGRDEARAAGPGRPKLGVVSREVSLLPRQWEWLATQSGGASATLRKLVDEAKKKSAGTSEVKQAQERAYKFMSVLAGDLPNYEEALRSLYRRDRRKFSELIRDWPEDVRAHAQSLAKPAFED